MNRRQSSGIPRNRLRSEAAGGPPRAPAGGIAGGRCTAHMQPPASISCGYCISQKQLCPSMIMLEETTTGIRNRRPPPAHAGTVQSETDLPILTVMHAPPKSALVSTRDSPTVSPSSLQPSSSPLPKQPWQPRPCLCRDLADSGLKPQHLRVIICDIARATVAEGCCEPDKARFQE